jgi:hypothetical protein
MGLKELGQCRLWVRESDQKTMAESAMVQGYWAGEEWVVGQKLIVWLWAEAKHL